MVVSPEEKRIGRSRAWVTMALEEPSRSRSRFGVIGVVVKPCSSTKSESMKQWDEPQSRRARSSEETGRVVTEIVKESGSERADVLRRMSSYAQEGSTQPSTCARSGG